MENNSIIPTEEHALALVQPSELALDLSPDDFDLVVEFAGRKARTLTKVVEQANLAINIKGNRYLKFEAWLTIAAGYGYSAHPEWTRLREDGAWECRVVARNRDGALVGAAESECGGPDDGHWAKESSNSRRSMAQTRAISKAYRSCLSWVVSLAGYSPTPADEMDHIPVDKPAVQVDVTPQKPKADSTPAPAPAPSGPKKVSEAQLGFIKDLTVTKAREDTVIAHLNGRVATELSSQEASDLMVARKALPASDGGELGVLEA